MRKLAIFSIFFLNALGVFAQEQESLFRQSGKIYVVVAVLSVIMVGIILFLLTLDRKIGKLEKKNK